MSLTHNKYTINLLAITFISFATIESTPTMAQTPSTTEETDQIQEITVTVQRREQNILDVPYNITAVSGDDIADSFVRDSAELLRSIPGVSQIDQGPRNAAQFNSVRIRGLNVDSSANSDYAVASVATVSTYLNETPVYANLALIDLDRVEVLRGPQATLYGSGALGGTIKYFLNEPLLGEIEGALGTALSSVKGSDGSLKEKIGHGTYGIFNYPLSDSLAVRANIFIQDYPGITDYVNLYQLDSDGIPVLTGTPNDTGPESTIYRTEVDADTYKSLYGRIALLWIPSDDTEITTTYIYQDDEVGGRRAQSDGADGFGINYDAYEQGAVILEPSDRTFDYLSIEATIDLDFATLTSASSYFDNVGSNISDNTGFYANNFPGAYVNYPRPLYTAERSYSDKAFVQELRLVGTLSGNFDYVVGLFYQDNDKSMSQVSDLIGFERWADLQWWANISPVSSDNVFTYRRFESYKENAVFGELTYNINDRLRLTFGARHFEVESNVETFVLADQAWDDYSDEASTTSTITHHDMLYKGNVSLDFGDDDLFYLTISEGFRRGGNNAVPTIGFFANDIGWTSYDSDTVINYEWGIKGNIDTIRYDLSTFLIDWRQPQFNTSTPAGYFFAVVNGDEAKTQGIELQLYGSISDNLNYAFGYALVDAKLSKELVEPADNTGTPIFIASPGAQLPGVPEHALNLAIDYFRTLPNGIDIALRLDGFYQSETQNIINENSLQSVEFDAFEIWDTSASIIIDNWTSSLFFKNIFNESGVTGSFTPEAFGTQPAAGFYGSNSRNFIALPRTIGIAINYQF